MNAKPAKKSRSKRPPAKKSRPRKPGAWRRALGISAVVALVATIVTLVWFPAMIWVPILLTCGLAAWVVSTMLG